MRRSNRGFTLVELMVILMLLGLILGLVLPNYYKSRYKAALEGCKQNLRTLAVAVQAYQVDNSGKLPGETGDFGTVTTDSLASDSTIGLLLTPYINVGAVVCPSKKGYNTTSYGYNINTGRSWMIYCDDAGSFSNGAHSRLAVPPRYPRLTNTEMQDAP